VLEPTSAGSSSAPFSSAGSSPLRTGITRPGPGIAVLDVHGEVDTLTAPPLEQATGELLAEPGTTVIVVDLTGVTFLASSGLAVLIRAAHRASSRDLRLRLVAAARAVRRPLEVTGSDQLFDMYEDVEGALATGA
jgi:anti-sigma B factor antagonist